MSWELALAIAATAYALLNEWLAFTPGLRANSLLQLALRLLGSLLDRFHPSVEAHTRRTMAEVDDQIRALHADWSIDYFQEQMQQAEARRLEILKEPGVEKVDLQLIGNQVALNITYAPDPELQTGESLGLGGAMALKDPRAGDSHPWFGW
jgi:hypothetical protein